MINFNVDINLTFEADCIKSAREYLDYIKFILKTLYNTELNISESDRLFFEGVKNGKK